jgi:protein-tyrosine phosphatase
LQTHPHDILPLTEGGRLIFTPCPGTKGVGLEESLSQLKQAGASALISLTPQTEMAHLQVEALPQACNKHGLDWFHLPIEDDAAPAAEFALGWARDREKILAILDQEGAVAIHCKGGSGRTGLMAAIIMLERGIDLEQVTSMVQHLRPKALQLQAHVEHLNELAGKLSKGGGS